jgi:hypothetical protein
VSKLKPRAVSPGIKEKCNVRLWYITKEGDEATMLVSEDNWERMFASLVRQGCRVVSRLSL